MYEKQAIGNLCLFSSLSKHQHRRFLGTKDFFHRTLICIQHGDSVYDSKRGEAYHENKNSQTSRGYIPIFYAHLAYPPHVSNSIHNPHFRHSSYSLLGTVYYIYHFFHMLSNSKAEHSNIRTRYPHSVGPYSTAENLSESRRIDNTLKAIGPRASCGRYSSSLDNADTGYGTDHLFYDKYTRATLPLSRWVPSLLPCLSCLHSHDTGPF